ncbi:hypothetical protein G9A89_023345 [Geosiphon pyriformis]|nr:hypothetical protein G9A89_023345 [Geosiphon pyriformis]
MHYPTLLHVILCYVMFWSNFFITLDQFFYVCNTNYSFTCAHKSGVCNEILAEAFAYWSVLAGVSGSSASTILWVLFQCFIDIGLYTLICKEFVLNE